VRAEHRFGKLGQVRPNPALDRGFAMARNMRDESFERVGVLMMEAAEGAILPHLRALAADEIEEKSPGELVTVADREAEAILAAGLAPLLPGSRVLGEEACSADPRLLDRLAEGTAWLVDPLDGTANFAAGRPVFAVTVALLRDGETQVGWARTGRPPWSSRRRSSRRSDRSSRRRPCPPPSRSGRAAGLRRDRCR
jgi:hypothetical protein